LAPRPAELRGRTVALLDITKNRSAEFLDRVDALLRERGAETFRIAKATFSRPAAPEVIEEIALRGDLVVEGLAD
jgi:alpha-galactosidase/6-phospho-beta-glucosidase family protein